MKRLKTHLSTSPISSTRLWTRFGCIVSLLRQMPRFSLNLRNGGKPVLKMSCVNSWDSIWLHVKVQVNLREQEINPDPFAARLINLTLLAPSIIETILMGDEPRGLSLTILTKLLPLCWAEQRGEPRFSSFTRIETAGSITLNQRLTGRPLHPREPPRLLCSSLWLRHLRHHFFKQVRAESCLPELVSVARYSSGVNCVCR